MTWPLQRKTPMRRGGQLKRVAMKRHPAKSKAEFSPEVREEIRRRSGGRCEAHIDRLEISRLWAEELLDDPSYHLPEGHLRDVCTGRAEHAHHIRRRWHGEGTAENGLDLCDDCHTWIHANVRLSNRAGWLIRSGREP